MCILNLHFKTHDTPFLGIRELVLENKKLALNVFFIKIHLGNNDCVVLLICFHRFVFEVRGCSYGDQISMPNDKNNNRWLAESGCEHTSSLSLSSCWACSCCIRARVGVPPLLPLILVVWVVLLAAVLWPHIAVLGSWNGTDKRMELKQLFSIIISSPSRYRVLSISWPPMFLEALCDDHVSRCTLKWANQNRCWADYIRQCLIVVIPRQAAHFFYMFCSQFLDPVCHIKRWLPYKGTDESQSTCRSSAFISILYSPNICLWLDIVFFITAMETGKSRTHVLAVSIGIYPKQGLRIWNLINLFQWENKREFTVSNFVLLSIMAAGMSRG